MAERQWRRASEQTPRRGRTVHAELRAGSEETGAAEKVRDQNKDPADHVRGGVQRVAAGETRGFPAGLDRTGVFVFRFLNIHIC